MMLPRLRRCAIGLARLGKPTRLERRMHKQIVQTLAQEWLRERGFRPMTDEEIAEAKAREEAKRDAK